MKEKSIQITFMIAVSVLLLMTVLTGCNKDQNASNGSSQKMIPGTWQTASMGYEYYGTYQPEYYVQFTNSEIIYGHMKNGEFIPDHTDRIIRLEEIVPGKFKVQAESANGTHYTYLTSESDNSVMEYYGTWSEEEFPETYSVGASLSSCN
ncbi:MAG: hypothetical protein K6C12_15600 [Oscillospiraceae bacterium]|nr:hypothetical protein [Oscillospiraceae bacterium]